MDLRRAVGRPRRVILLVLLAAAVTSALVFRPWLAAQARAAVVLSIALRAPGLAWMVERVTDEPRVADTVVVGAPTTIVRPGEGDGPWPAVVFVNGATRQGRRHPDVRRLAEGLARAGYVVLIPDLPGLALGEITDATVDRTVAVALAAAARRDATGGEIGLVGVSVGATLALLAAEDPSLAPKVTVVGGVAPYTDLGEVIRLATTEHQRIAGRLYSYSVDPYVSLAVARSLAASLPPTPDRQRLLGRLEAVDDDADEPLVALRSLPLGGLSPEARSVVSLLANADPRRFDPLYARLPPAVRLGIRRLSPLYGAGRLQARVELASAPHDKYFPPAQSRALVRRAADTRLTVTPTLEHAIPSPSPRDIAGVFRFAGFVVRVLRAARG